MAYSMNHPHGMCPDCTGLGVRVQLDEERMFDREKSIREGAIRFSQFSTGSWQSFYYYNNPQLDPDKKLRDFTREEWQILRIGPDTPLVMDYARNNTGQVSKLPYEGVVSRFNRLYLNRAHLRAAAQCPGRGGFVHAALALSYLRRQRPESQGAGLPDLRLQHCGMRKDAGQ